MLTLSLLVFLIFSSNDNTPTSHSSASNLTQIKNQKSEIPKPCENYNTTNKRFTVVIDPGHGGKDHGCSNHSCKEKDITLPFSILLGRVLKEKSPTIEVVYTRTADTRVGLNNRINKGNSSNADIFISIHANTIAEPSVRGFETYIYGEPSAGELGNDFIYHEDFVTDLGSHSTFHIIENIKKNATLNNSISLASSIDSEVTKIKSYKSRGLKQAKFRVLSKIEVPSVLLELGYLSNQQDANLLQSKEGQKILSNKIAEGIVKYLHQTT